MQPKEHNQTKLHPVLWAAAVSVIVFSAVGVAALTGVLPTAGSKTAEPVASTAGVPGPMALADMAATAPAALPAVEPATQSTGLAPADTVPKSVAEKALSDAAPKRVVAKPAPEPKKVVKVVHAKPKPVQLAQYEAPVVDRAPAQRYEPAPRYQPATVARTCADCGVIESVREIKGAGEGSGLGAVAGGVLGGVLGHQVGGGRGQDVATVLGAVGGAVAGHQVEKNVRSGTKYEVVVRYDDGTSQSFQQTTRKWQRGDRVRVVDGVIRAD